MKYFALSFSILLALFLGFYPNLAKPKPMIWKIFAIFIVSIALVLTILPPLSGTFEDAIFLKSSKEHQNVDVYLKIQDNLESKDDNYYISAKIAKPYTISGLEYDSDKYNYKIKFDTKPNFELSKSNKYVLNLRYNSDEKVFIFNKLISINPYITYPYIPALVQRIKILNLHVPMSWTAFIAFFISMFYAIKYLNTRDLTNDIFASSSALLGLIFTLLATSTGMIWAKFNWGAYWNWDPRQISIFVLLMIYFAYFALRASFDSKEKKAKLSSVYSILSFVTVPFLIFIIPRLYTGLHPGAKGDETTGPVISPNEGMLDSSLAFTYYISLAGFIILFFWLMNLLVRYHILNEKLEEIE